MRVLVTGGAGFIGSHLVDALLAAGHDVRVLDNFSTGKRANLAHHSDNRRLTVVEGSITDAVIVEALTVGCALVYHLAAAIGVRYVMDDPLSGIDVNVRGAEEVLAAAARAGARVVLASSSEVYGKGTAEGLLREDQDSVIGPTGVTRWWYALAKALDEHLAFAYHRQKGLAVSAVRYFNVYGPRCDPGGYGVLARFITQALQGKPLTIFGDGEQTRSFTYVDDAVRATLLSGERAGAVGEAFNVGSGVETAINEAARRVIAITESASTLTHLPYDAVYGANFEDTRRRVPDVTKARTVLGFQCAVDLEAGIARTARWWENNRE